MRTAMLCALGLLSGCITAGPLPPLPAIAWQKSADAAEYARYKMPGSGTLSGQAFLRTRGGDVKTCAGSEVTLDPATSLADEWWLRAGMVYRRKDETPPDAAFREARKAGICDAEGRFRFSGLAAGVYYVRTEVTWETGAAYGSQGGLIGELVGIAAGETKEIILTQK